MITIALDESGTFEKYGEEGQSDILLIAGIVYDDKKNENDKKDEDNDNEDDSDDLINEQKRLNE